MANQKSDASVLDEIKATKALVRKLSREIKLLSEQLKQLVPSKSLFETQDCSGFANEASCVCPKEPLSMYTGWSKDE